MPQITVTNALVLNRATALRAMLNGDSFGLLYTNIVTPTPNTTLGDLILATFPGYAAINLVGLWGAPVKLDAGVYAVVCPTQDFTCTGASAEIVRGAGIYSSLGLLATMPFNNPITLHAGRVIPVQFTMIESALLQL